MKNSQHKKNWFSKVRRTGKPPKIIVTEDEMENGTTQRVNYRLVYQEDQTEVLKQLNIAKTMKKLAEHNYNSLRSLLT